MPVEWSLAGFYAPIVTNLSYGSPVVAYDREEFEPEKAFEIIEKYGVNRGMVSADGAPHDDAGRRTRRAVRCHELRVDSARRRGDWRDGSGVGRPRVRRHRD